jgi:hypothetical protein
MHRKHFKLSGPHPPTALPCVCRCDGESGAWQMSPTLYLKKVRRHRPGSNRVARRENQLYQQKNPENKRLFNKHLFHNSLIRPDKGLEIIASLIKYIPLLQLKTSCTINTCSKQEGDDDAQTQLRKRFSKEGCGVAFEYSHSSEPLNIMQH